MRHVSLAPHEVFCTVWRNRFLIKTMIIREIQSRYRGSLIGIFWSLINPLLILSIYTFVFSKIFEARWNGGTKLGNEYSLVLFSGLIIFNFFSECFISAPQLIVKNISYVKKIVFPLEILPVVLLGSALFHMVINFFVWLVSYFIFFGIPHATIFFSPIIFFPLMMVALGICWMLSSLGVFFRDINQLVTLFMTALMFLSPIFYPVSAFPLEFRNLLYINPLTTVIEQIRNTLYWGEYPNFSILGIYWISSFIIFWLGFIWFQKTRKGFSDVL